MYRYSLGLFFYAYFSFQFIGDTCFMGNPNRFIPLFGERLCAFVVIQKYMAAQSGQLVFNGLLISDRFWRGEAIDKE